jgi:hypothetical protein
VFASSATQPIPRPVAPLIARRALAVTSGAMFAFAGLVVGSVALALVVAVMLVDEGRAVATPGEIAVARLIAGYWPVIAGAAAAHVVAAFGIALGRRWARPLGVGVAAAGSLALAWTVLPPVASFGVGGALGDPGAGVAIVTTLIGAYALAAAAAVLSAESA